MLAEIFMVRAPAAFNTPQTLDQIFQYNDVQLFDLKQDPQELHNLALDRENRTISSLTLHFGHAAAIVICVSSAAYHWSISLLEDNLLYAPYKYRLARSERLIRKAVGCSCLKLGTPKVEKPNPIPQFLDG